MKKQALNYRFHNPNTAEATAGYIVKILLEANRGKAEQAIQTASQLPQQKEMIRSV